MSNSTILLVVENTMHRERLGSLLAENHTVLPVRSAHSALIVLRQYLAPIDLLLTTPDLTGMSGHQLSCLARRERPNLQSVLLNADCNADQLREALQQRYLSTWNQTPRDLSTRSFRAGT
jgi:DNA-binding NtrC family response regulator